MELANYLEGGPTDVDDAMHLHVNLKPDGNDDGMLVLNSL